MTACIGTNFNNDGTALYQATAVLFIAQALGFDLSLGDQVMIMLTTLIASVGAGGIPSGSFVTMPLIFAAVRMPVDKIPILLTVDWLLDRLRTTSNVLGDMTVAVLLDRVSPPASRRPSTDWSGLTATWGDVAARVDRGIAAVRMKSTASTIRMELDCRNDRATLDATMRGRRRWRRPSMAEAAMRERVWVWGVPFAPITLDEAVAAVSG